MKLKREEKRLDQVTQDDFDGGRVILTTFSGKLRITGVNVEWWVVAPEANCGMGQSFCCSPDTKVTVFNLV